MRSIAKMRKFERKNITQICEFQSKSWTFEVWTRAQKSRKNLFHRFFSENSQKIFRNYNWSALTQKKFFQWIWNLKNFLKLKLIQNIKNWKKNLFFNIIFYDEMFYLFKYKIYFRSSKNHRKPKIKKISITKIKLFIKKSNISIIKKGQGKGKNLQNTHHRQENRRKKGKIYKYFGNEGKFGEKRGRNLVETKK